MYFYVAWNNLLKHNPVLNAWTYYKKCDDIKNDDVFKNNNLI